MDIDSRHHKEKVTKQPLLVMLPTNSRRNICEVPAPSSVALVVAQSLQGRREAVEGISNDLINKNFAHIVIN